MSSRLRILIIDDDPPVARSISRSLGRDYETHEETDAARGLWEALNGAWDVVLCDVGMPGGGPVFLANVTCRQPLVARRIVFTSGDVNVDPSLVAGSSGCFVGKPFSKKTLEDAVFAVVNAEGTHGEEVA